MAIIKCKMCGGDIELSADKSFGVCEFCGSTMTLPKVDDEQRAAAFNRGNHFRRIGEFDKALTVYESLVRDNESDAEAHWCCALCRFGIEYVKDPASGEYIPTCHRASFDSFLEDVDTKEAIAHADAVARRQYEHDAQVIEEVRRGILTLSQNEKPYDVFICYKETDDKGQRTIDSQRAQEIYYQLTDQGRRVFFARITLEDKAGQQYEPYIFAALNSAKVMIVVGTRREHLEAVWVKNEWSRFLAIMKRDRKKLLIPCYADMDPYDMPEQLSVLQSYDMTKIGFIQDLTRGISKVLDSTSKRTMDSISGKVNSDTEVNAFLRRAKIFAENGEFKDADKYYDRVLDIRPECTEAYIGKLCAEYKCTELEMIPHKIEASYSEAYNKKSHTGPFGDLGHKTNYNNAKRFGDSGTIEKLQAVENEVRVFELNFYIKELCSEYGCLKVDDIPKQIEKLHLEKKYDDSLLIQPCNIEQNRCYINAMHFADSATSEQLQKLRSNIEAIEISSYREKLSKCQSLIEYQSHEHDRLLQEIEHTKKEIIDKQKMLKEKEEHKPHNSWTIIGMVAFFPIWIFIFAIMHAGYSGLYAGLIVAIVVFLICYSQNKSIHNTYQYSISSLKDEVKKSEKKIEELQNKINTLNYEEGRNKSNIEKLIAICQKYDIINDATAK